MTDKQRIAILCGGQSAEHDISVISARTINQTLKTMFDTTIVYITEAGAWYALDDAESLQANEPRDLVDNEKAHKLLLSPGAGAKALTFANDPTRSISTDCIFPMLHGTNGEDGRVQGMLEMLGLPYVGCDAVSAAICMEKILTKRLLRQAGIATPNWVEIYHYNRDKFSYESVAKELGEVFFVKPATLGSSIGMTKVKKADQFEKAIDFAFMYDQRVVVEAAVIGREIECSVIGNEEPSASLPGEVVCHHEYYSYEAKYCDPKAAEIISPADLPREIVTKIQKLAVETYKTLFCSGLARVDFFLEDNGTVSVNEVNPMPGMTQISLYLKNWAVTGSSHADILNELIRLAQQRFEERKALTRICVTDTNKSSDTV